MAGETLWTREHETIQTWAEDRHAVPSTVAGSNDEGSLGALGFDFSGQGGDGLEHITWEQFFKTFEERNLIFVYQETTRTGAGSTFFRFDAPRFRQASQSARLSPE